MRQILGLILGQLTNKLVGELTDNLVNPPTKSRSSKKKSKSNVQPDRTAQLDKQLQELAEDFIPDKSSHKRKKSNKADPPTISHQNEYWSELSTWYRKQKGWTCEQCSLNLKKDKKYLDTHHVLGRGYNSPEHLKALCVGCHAEQKTPNDHSFMKNDKRYWQFMRTYRKRR